MLSLSDADSSRQKLQFNQSQGFDRKETWRQTPENLKLEGRGDDCDALDTILDKMRRGRLFSKARVKTVKTMNCQYHWNQRIVGAGGSRVYKLERGERLLIEQKMMDFGW